MFTGFHSTGKKPPSACTQWESITLHTGEYRTPSSRGGGYAWNPSAAQDQGSPCLSPATQVTLSPSTSVSSAPSSTGVLSTESDERFGKSQKNNGFTYGQPQHTPEDPCEEQYKPPTREQVGCLAGQFQKLNSTAGESRPGAAAAAQHISWSRAQPRHVPRANAWCSSWGAAMGPYLLAEERNGLQVCAIQVLFDHLQLGCTLVSCPDVHDSGIMR